jgi:hypothetical protein
MLNQLLTWFDQWTGVKHQSIADHVTASLIPSSLGVDILRGAQKRLEG